MSDLHEAYEAVFDKDALITELRKSARALLADFSEMLHDKRLLQMALEMARDGRPLEFDSDGGPQTVRDIKAALARADAYLKGKGQ